MRGTRHNPLLKNLIGAEEFPFKFMTVVERERIDWRHCSFIAFAQ